MITCSIFILFVLYTLACIADGPDVKPILNRKIGNYLHKQANKFYKVCYCNPYSCTYYYTAIKYAALRAKSDVEIINYNTELIKHTVVLDEYQKYLLRNNLSSVNYINTYKQICSDSILKKVKERIKFDIIEDISDGRTYITGSVVCNKKV